MKVGIDTKLICQSLFPQKNHLYNNPNTLQIYKKHPINNNNKEKEQKQKYSHSLQKLINQQNYQLERFTMPKQDPLHLSHHNTYVMASTLMQKLMLTHQNNLLINSSNNRAQGNIQAEQLHPYRNLNIDLDPSTVHLSNEFTIDRPAFHLNLEYQPVLLPANKKWKLAKLSNPSKLKPVKPTQQNQQQPESRMMQKLKRNLLNDNHSLSTTRKQKHMHTHTSEYEEHKVAGDKQASTIEKDKSPNKVSVNFELFFPKQKMRTTINHNKTATRHSMGLKNLQTDLFRIKKSAKSISLTHQQKSSQLAKSKLPSHSTDRAQGEEILVGLKKNAALKYIEKVQKFKKYKDNKMNKQPLFGLNVMQVEYHDLKIQNELKQKDRLTKGKKPHFFCQQESLGKNHSNHQQGGRSQVFMNITMSQGVSISLNNRRQDPEKKKLQDNEVKDQVTSSPQNDKKCPSEQKLVAKTFFGPAQIERKRLMIKSKWQDDSSIKEKQKGTFKGKLKNMLECLDILLNAFCCRIITIDHEQPHPTTKNNNKSLLQNTSQPQPQPPSHQQPPRNLTISQPTTLPLRRQKFLYYVGNGNNKNLIRSIMKKRGWWVETQSMENANFVWSQLKIKEVLEREAKIAERIVDEPDSWNFKVREEEFENVPKQYKNKQHTSTKPQHFNIPQNMLKIFHKQMLPVYTKKIQQKQRQHSYLRPLPTPGIIHNHYDANYMLGNKKALFYNLLEYCAYKKLPPNSIIPLTFHIESTDSRQFRNFLKTAKKSKNALWIVKPGENSNRGNGIFVQKDLQKIKSHIQKHSTPNHSFIIQKYLKHIFLYQRRKFDIRVYLLMSTIGGITKFYWYQEGYIRTSSMVYNTEDIGDLFIHLTNDAVQCKNETYSKYQKGNKVSYAEFQRYLDMNYYAEGYRVEGLVAKMKQVAETVVRATYFKLDKGKKVNGFELFGLDFLVDKQFTPWLLQVNTNPCLQLSSPVLERIIPRMIENMLRLTIDPVFRPNQSLSRHNSYFLYDNVFETNKFQLVFDSLFDSDFEWEEICLKGIGVVYEDEDQVFESNGVEVEMVD